MKESIKYTDLTSEEVFQLVMWMLDPKAIDGALRSAIHAHGPITFNAQKLQIAKTQKGAPVYVPKLTLPNLLKQWVGVQIPNEDQYTIDSKEYSSDTMGTCGSSSAAKRIRGAMKTRVEEYFKAREKSSVTLVSESEETV